MEPISSSSVVDALNWRYATKQFDPERKIPSDDWAAIEQSLVLTPSSFGLQPWKFIVVDDPAVREAILPNAWNQRQVVDCSHLVVIAAVTDLGEEEVDKLINVSAEKRGVEPAVLDGYREMMLGMIVKGMDADQRRAWAVRQGYIALGNLMTVAAMLQVDACPMEGFVPAEVDKILGLPERGLTAALLCPLGYRAAEDKYADAPKVRYPVEDLIERV
ncbi:NAD(P)H-dependent oxidoreductase [Sulfuriroseicoccus oceanibius]|uniref:NAD(P)H-dependent oxidoreductase n=1 Tax=Sulfuriroseicoccus oceanibius TaxID=2707525 RepID=A0A6B3L3T2_9BACT|nr:NAD(P)H-dependent oxidoreductase [Sulfuriroseicoccus oceanibius]QQL46147.1 NAD(P)H-dependent oxidoreductase [Sulfuriroseicoccus oceanibius]